MIIRSYPHRNLYGNYFLATEAPDEEQVTDENKPRRNVKVVSVKPDNRRRKDFSAVGADEPPEEEMPIEPDAADAPVGDDGDDFTQDEPDSNNVPLEPETDQVDDFSDEYDTATANDATNEANADDGDNVPDSGEGEDFAVDNIGDGVAPDTGNTTDAPEVTDNGEEATGEETDPDAPDTGEGEDFSADTGDEDNPEGGDEVSTDAGMSAGEENKPGLDYDSTRKYQLFKEFLSLHNSCENFISKFESMTRDNIYENRVIQISANDLREIRDLLYDYMVIKYPANSYVQSLLFYQKMVVAVQLIFRRIKITKEEINKGRKSKK